MHSFGVLSVLSLFFFDAVLWFVVLLAVFFELDVRPAVTWGVLPSMPSDLRAVSSEDLNILDSDQWREKIINDELMVIIL